METSALHQSEEQSSPRERFFERYKGDEDEFGFDVEEYRALEVFIRFFYEKWFAVKTIGLENIPAEGKAVLFGNHSGVLPIDGCLLYDGVINYHPQPRRMRFLITDFLRKAPVIGKSLRGFGCVPADYDVAIKLLNKDELVFFYPEAEEGTGKLFKDRYNLVDFHNGFVRAAIATGAPVFPVITVGGDEIYPLLGNLKPIAKLMDAPYWPITPFYPLLPFPFNAIPLPIKMLICVGKPFKLDFPPEKAEDHDFATEIANELRRQSQEKLNGLLELRGSPFSKWNTEKVQEYWATASVYSPPGSTRM